MYAIHLGIVFGHLYLQTDDLYDRSPLAFKDCVFYGAASKLATTPSTTAAILV